MVILWFSANGESSNSSDEKDKDGPSHPHQSRHQHYDVDLHPRKRKLRHRTDLPAENSSGSPPVPPPHQEKIENPFALYLSIRKQVCNIHCYLKYTGSH